MVNHKVHLEFGLIIVPGLAMTRSMGDRIAKTVGVID
jgi:hypothetical protein